MSSKFAIDINGDVGEGIGNETQLMPYISSCSIACNEHAGSVTIIDEVITLAKKNQVKIGAHPSFPDRENFGRKALNMASKTLQRSLENQINLLIERTALQGVKLHHIKPHGALYNLVFKDEKTAQAVINAIKNTASHVFLYAPYNSIIAQVALKNNIKIKYEAFADRNYKSDLSLISRTQANAMITNKEEVLNQVKNVIMNKKVQTVSGEKDIQADTICVHGDTKNAIELVQYICRKLAENNIAIV